MHISDFDYNLPPDLIAKEPVRPRDASRMMVVDRRSGDRIDTTFRSLTQFLRPSDVLVLNDTRVIRARMYGKLERALGETRPVEVLFVAPRPDGVWEVMCRPGKRIHSGDRITFDDGGVKGVFHEGTAHGLRLLELIGTASVEGLLERCGHIPLPPYLDREDTAADETEYQTVYGTRAGAVAAPTAGLHFSNEVLAAIQRSGVDMVKITLHVGIGTFVPVRAEDPRAHILKPERFEVTAEAAERLNVARDAGRRIIAVGTTTTRTLEYMVDRNGRFSPGPGEADLFILPGHEFRAISGMLTNFHLPRSTLLMMVSAFASRQVILDSYLHAVEQRYRFYTYGDCMLLL